MTESNTATYVTSLKFTDVVDSSIDENRKDNPISQKETPIIFLERCYSGVQGGKRDKIEAAVIRFAAEKAKEAGCKLVVSNDYSRNAVLTATNQDIKKPIFVFITKSKAGRQYLDSFGGEFSNRSLDGSKNENVYLKTECYVA